MVSLGLLWLLAVSVEPRRLGQAFLAIDWFFWFAALSVALLGFLISCFKWSTLLRSDGVDCGFSRLAGFYLIGYFFNNFLPTAIGGDAARMFLAGKACGRYQVAVNSVLAERFSGLLALILVGVFGIFMAPSVVGPTFAALFIGCGIFLWLLLLFPLVCRSARMAWLFPGGRIFSSVVEAVQGTLYYFFRPGLFIPLAWTSLVFQLLAVVTYFVAARALHVDVSLAQMLAVVPVVSLLTLIPVSLNGLGVREGGFAYFLARAGVPEADAIALSLLVYAITLVFSMGGAVVLAFYRKGGDLPGLWSFGEGES